VLKLVSLLKLHQVENNLKFLYFPQMIIYTIT
jgi:hypothetical protein